MSLNEQISVSPAVTPAEEISAKEMIEAGVFYGCHKSKTNPRIRSYIFAKRGGIEIIDMAKTIELLDGALAFLEEGYKSGKNILIAGTHPAASGTIEKFSKEFSLPFVNKRWLGGLLTNFKTMFGRKEQMKKLKTDLLGGAFGSYTKKERLEIDRKIRRMEELFGGVESLMQLPDILLVIDPHLHRTAVREARQLGIKIVALGDTTSDPDAVDHLVIGNTKSRSSVNWFMDKVAEALRRAVRDRALGTDIISEGKKEEDASS